MPTPTAPIWLTADSGDFSSFERLMRQTADPAATPNAAQIVKNIPIYDGGHVATVSADPARRQALRTEWAWVFAHGAGIVVIKRGMADTGVVDRASAVFDRIIRDEKQSGGGGGDHFAKPGANDRVWNALEKHCRADPANFAAYFSAPGIAIAAEAWLGPNSQMTAQVNRVNPGGAAQTPHRDYHLGFMPADRTAQYPAHVHALSPMLTLQGAVAHCDMAVETGPTMLLPFSQQFFEGYLAFNRLEYQAYFAENYVQLPLEKGDLVFFNPAVMHGAGTNHTTDTHRLVNLLQISSAFGRAIETVDRAAMLRALYPVLAGAGPGIDVAHVIAASAEGYPFPTNLDADPPVGGLAPRSQADLLRNALREGHDAATFAATLNALDARRKS